jgi:hypothetical protein
MENVEGADDEQYERARQRQREDLNPTKKRKAKSKERKSESGQYAKEFAQSSNEEGEGGGVQRESTHLSWTSVEVPCGGAGVEEEGGAPEHTQKAGELQ